MSPDARRCAHEGRVRVEDVAYRNIVDGELYSGTVLFSRGRGGYLSKAQRFEFDLLDVVSRGRTKSLDLLPDVGNAV